MAKTVEALLIKLGVDGIQGIDAVKSSLRALGKAAGPVDRDIRKIRTEILEFANAGQSSTQAIRGVVDSFKALQAQASIGSSVYRQLAADIESLEGELKSLTPEAEKAAKAIRAFGPSKVPNEFVEDMKERRRQLQGLAVDSDQYLERLVAIKNFEAQQAARVGRQEVRAAARVAQTGIYSNIVQSEQPATLAALRLRIGEVQTEIENLDFTTKDYADANRELIALQQSLKEALGGTSESFDKLSEAQARSARRAEKLAGIQAAQVGQAGTINPRTGARMAGRDPKTGVMIAGGSAVSPIPKPIPELSSLYKTITQIETAGVDATLDRMGKSFQQVTNDIRSASAASNGSINSLQAQKNALSQLRAGLDPTSQDFRELAKEIEKVDRKLEKASRQRRRPTFRGAASMLGGIAAGGVFGGPEGAIGGAVGGAVGGVAGVAAGAALGAQVKMLREALGATANYAAELKKLEIALEGVTEVQDKFGNKDVISSLGNYQAGLKAASDVTRDFNIPLDVSTKGITRLAAAVIGAGGNITDAEIVFRNITSAIKATGGGAQDVDSAITAMVQTFSKGKVSAEELSGQLGERLPGAVTKFAEANNMTLPELQKAFKAGTVGLDELMKFVVSLGPEYEETARQIADSSADSGAKAAVAFQQVRREIGEALQPIGGELQKAFADFALSILPAIKGAAGAAGTALKGLMNISAGLIANFKEVLAVVGVAGVTLALQNLISIAAALGTAVGKATVAMKGLTAASLLNPFVALAAGITAATIALIKHTKKNEEFNKSVISGNTSNEEANDRLRDINDKVKELEERLEKETNNRMIKALKNQLDAAKAAAGDLKLAMELASSYEVAGVKYDRMTGRAINAPMSVSVSDFPDADADGGGSGSARVMMTQAELDLRRQIREAQEAGNKSAASQYQLDLDILLAKQETEDAIKRTNDIEIARFDFRQRGRDIAKEEADAEQRKADAEAERLDKIEQARVLAGEITQEEYNRAKTLKEMEVLLKDMPDLYEKIKAKLYEVETAMKKFKDGLKKVFEEAINLKDALAVKGVQAVQQLGDAFADFVATGKANFKELTASILQDLARIFARAALFKSLSFIPGVSSFLGLGGNVGTAGSSDSFAGVPLNILNSVLENKYGNAFGKNGIVPFSRGGMVNKPTLFQYANGGSGRFGLMGEAGPEAIMPLRRGRNGKLGVESSGSIGNVVVNVDASGSSAQGNEPNAKALGQAIGAAVQAELIKQKRPGGLLS